MWNWDSRTHQFIVRNALTGCRRNFVKMLSFHQELFIFGIEAPDRIFKDFTNHYYNCTPNKYGHHYGKVIDKIVNESDLISRIMKQPEQIITHPNIAPFLKTLLDTPLKSFIFELGVISHYIADLHQPLHTDGKERFADEMTVHQIFEADTRIHLSDIKITMKKRRTRIGDKKIYFEEQAYRINHNYDAIIDNYFLKKGKVKANRWNPTFPIAQYCLSKAAQNVANIFLDFETAPKIFKFQTQREKLKKRIEQSLNKKGKYYLKKYHTGTISIRKYS